jgi:hypothetical protein
MSRGSKNRLINWACDTKDDKDDNEKREILSTVSLAAAAERLRRRQFPPQSWRRWRDAADLYVRMAA